MKQIKKFKLAEEDKANEFLQKHPDGDVKIKGDEIIITYEKPEKQLDFFIRDVEENNEKD